MRLWSIRKTCPSQRSRLSLSMLSMVCCPVLALTSTLVILSRIVIIKDSYYICNRNIVKYLLFQTNSSPAPVGTEAGVVQTSGLCLLFTDKKTNKFTFSQHTSRKTMLCPDKNRRLKKLL